jgi:hypothetical protein
LHFGLRWCSLILLRNHTLAAGAAGACSERDDTPECYRAYGETIQRDLQETEQSSSAAIAKELSATRISCLTCFPSFFINELRT